MKKISVLILIFIVTNSVFGQKKNEFGVKFSGYILSEAFFDTRQVVNSREGDVGLFPENKKLDINGNDINDKFNFNLLSLQSRVHADINGKEAFGARTSGAIEVDFVGTGNSYIHLVRLRHAYIKLQWAESNIIFGQYWHPMFANECNPSVISQGSAIPFSALSRNPQIRYTQNLTSNLYLMLAVLTQRDFSSPGPFGISSSYLRNSGIPEIQSKIAFDNNNLALGAVLGYKTLQPRLETVNGQKTESSIGSYNFSAYFKLITTAVTFKILDIYGQNLYNFGMLGGYAESSLPNINTGDVEYTNYKTNAVWTEIFTNGDLIQYGFFAGFTKNLGSDKEIFGDSFTRESKIDFVYRLSPRVSVTVNDLKVALEGIYTAAAYGIPNNFGVVKETEIISNFRLLFSCKYNF